MAKTQSTEGPQPFTYPLNAAVEGPYGLLVDPRTGLPHTLGEKGRELIRNPNEPFYDPENIGRRLDDPTSPSGLPFPVTPQYRGQDIRIGQGEPSMIQDPMVSMLQGPSDPAMSALFAHPAQHLQRMAGEVIPFPVSPQVADMRRMRHEDMMHDINTRFGQPGVDQYRTMWPPAPVELGPGAVK